MENCEESIRKATTTTKKFIIFLEVLKIHTISDILIEKKLTALPDMIQRNPKYFHNYNSG